MKQADKISRVFDDFPAIFNIRDQCFNDRDSWMNTTENTALSEATEKSSQLHRELLEECGEPVQEKLYELEEAYEEVQSELCDMAFVEGFRSAAKLCFELLK